MAAFYFLNWNRLRPLIAHRVTAVSGRSFAINGDLGVRLSLRPRIIANDIVIGNASWSSEPNMGEFKRLDFRVDLPKLLTGRLDFPAIALSAPRLLLEVSKNGTPNWVFTEQDKKKPIRLPEIGTLAIDHGRASYRDPRINTDITVEIETLDRQQGPESMVGVSGTGRFKGMPSSIVGRGGALLNLADLGGVIGANRGGKPADVPPPSGKVLPQEPFSLKSCDLAPHQPRKKP